jgi:hypothetical protein
MFSWSQVNGLLAVRRLLACFETVGALFFRTTDDLDKRHIGSQTLHRMLVLFRPAMRENAAAYSQSAGDDREGHEPTSR